MNEKRQHLIDLTHTPPSIREGIEELIKYDYDVRNKEFGFSEVIPEKALLKLIKGIAYTNFFERWSILSEMFQNLSGYIYKELGYDFESAYELRDKLCQVDESTDDKEIIALLREFDKISCCISKLNIYPSVLIESLGIIEYWLSMENTQNCEEDILYVLSLYDSLCMSSTYNRVITERNYHRYKNNGFMSPQKRKLIRDNGNMDAELESGFDFFSDIDDLLGPNSLEEFERMLFSDEGLDKHF